MNDNLIKMFIGGEEVVSNKEFTINEEMLSASSTILNNCYPASWEESKDYVSNFYYPKDYSKFILGKGNFTYGNDEFTIFETKYKNLFNAYGDFTYGNTNHKTYFTNGELISLSNYYAWRSSGQLLPLEHNKEYTVSGTLVFANGTFSSRQAVIEIRTNNTSIKSISIPSSVVKPYDFTFTFNSGEYDNIFISFNGMNSSAADETYTVFKNIKIYESDINYIADDISFNTNVEKNLENIKIYGNTYQEKRQSTNYFNAMNFNNSTIVVTEQGKIITMPIATSGNGITGTGRTLKELAPNLNVGDTVYLYFDRSGQAYNRYIYLHGSSFLWIVGNARTITQEDLDGNVSLYANRYNSGETQQITISNFRIIKNPNTPWEPFGNMPSPDYPSQLVSVGYKNLYEDSQNFGGIWNNNSYWETDTETYNGLVVKKRSSSWYGLSKDISIEKGKTYTFSLYAKSTESRPVSIYLRGSSGQITDIETLAFNTTKDWKRYHITFTATSSGILKPRIENTTIIANNYTYIAGYQIEESSIMRGYVDYGKYGIELSNTGKNIFNSEDWYNTLHIVYQTSMTKEVVNGIEYYKFRPSGIYNYKYMLGQFKENTQYTLSCKARQYEYQARNTTGFLFIYTDGTSSGELINQTINEYDYKITSQAGKTVSYIRLSYYNNDYQLVRNIQLEEGIQATPYEQFKGGIYSYILNEPLRSLGETTDLFYIQNGILYIERKIGSIVLNGSESGWYIGDSGNTGNIKRFVLSLPTSLPYQANILKSNYFIGRTTYALNIEGININTSSLLSIYKDENDLTSFKTWLSTHNTEVQYILAEPYTEELGKIEMPKSYTGINYVNIYDDLKTLIEIYYYWKNYDVLFAGIVKNSGDISLKPTNPKYCSLQILDYKTFLSESDTLDFVISDKTIAEAISMVVDAIRGYGFILGTINISQADDIIGAYSTLNKTAYDVFQYLANISGSRWRARFVDSDTMAIDFYDPELLPRANDIDYTQQYWEDNKIVDLTFNYGTRDYRNKQIILSDEVYGGIDYTEVLLSNGYGTSYITQNNIANITSITVNGVEAEVITQSEKDLGVDADFYYTPGKNVVESTTSYTAGTQIIITYTPLVKGRQIVYNDEEVTRIATQTNTTGVISRYENRNDILSSDELENIAETYIKYKGKPEIILKLTTLNNDLFNIGEICYFNSPIADLAQDYMVKSKATNYTSVAGETNIFYTYELTSSFNSEKAINYFDNQRNKATGNIAEGESITRNIDINNSAMIIWENATITEISVSVDGDNALNSVLNSPFIQ